jgi:hypothetical protein
MTGMIDSALKAAHLLLDLPTQARLAVRRRRLLRRFGRVGRPVRRVFTDELLEDHLIALGYPPVEARATVVRRGRELAEWGGGELPVVDRTTGYWEYRVPPR